MLRQFGVFARTIPAKRFRHFIPPHEIAEAEEREIVKEIEKKEKEIKKERDNKDTEKKKIERNPKIWGNIPTIDME